jgi:CheY-like chemotaxis protein
MNKYILVVDDDAQMRSMLQQVLESEAYIVDTASDGRIALDKILHRPEMPDVILLDMTMPGMNGLQLIEALRQRKEACVETIIAYSGNMDALEQARGLGIGRCLAKPFDLETFLELLSTRVA